jgi:iron complex outermembrane receptor protein
MNGQLKNRFRTLCCFAPILLLCSMGSALAQEAAEDDVVLEEVLVTAQKRAANLQDVSISITAITGDMMDDFQVKSLADYIRMVPGLSTSNQTNSFNAGPRTVGLRGIQSVSGAFLSGQNTVGFYIDNTPVPITDPRLVDLERIEVLRGPQGTLYGASALAGAIRMITRQPNFESFEAQAMAKYGDTEYGGSSWTAEGLVNLPLSDNFAVRISAYHDDRDGYVDMHEIDLMGNPTGNIFEDANSASTTGGRISAAWQVSENFQVRGSVMTQEIDVDNNDWLNVPNPGGTPDVGLGIVFNQLGIGAPNYAPLDGNPNADYDDPLQLGRFRQVSHNEFTLYSVEFDWQINPDMQLISVFSSWNDEYFTDLDSTDSFGFFLDQGPAILIGDYNDENDEFTNETRLQSTWDSKFQYTLGFFYQDREEFYWTRFPTPPGSTVFGFPNTDGFIFYSDSERKRQETALFGQASYDFSEKWRGVFGARYFKFDFDSWDHFIGNPLFVANGDVLLTTAEDDSDWVPSFTLEYRPFEETLLYATAAEGFRMGGTNFPLPNTDACRAETLARIGTETMPLGFESDSLWNYELGLKKAWADGRVNTNIAVFMMDWQDTQVFTGALCGLNGAVVNVGAVESTGVEWEVQAAVSENLFVSFTGAYVDSEVTEDAQPVGSTLPPIAAKGSPLPDVPEWSWSLLADWSVPINESLEGFVRGDYSYRDETSRDAFGFGNFDNPRATDDYYLLNLRAGIHWSEWELSAFVENATNELPSTFGRPSNTALVGWRYWDTTLRPRTYGVSAQWRFN